MKICTNCKFDYRIESEENPGLCPTCNLTVVLFGKPQADGRRSKGILNNG